MFPTRYLMAIMGSIGLAIIYGFKVNVSVAIVAMVNHTAVKLSTLHQLDTENTTVTSLNECHYDSALSNATKTVTEVRIIGSFTINNNFIITPSNPISTQLQ